MCGSATLAMLVSSTSMKAAKATTTAISHGLCFGRHTSGGGAGAERVSVLLDIDLRIHRHAGAQSMVAVLVGVDIDADGNALHHFHVVSGGVLGRQETESGAAGAADAGDPALIFAAVGVDA